MLLRVCVCVFEWQLNTCSSIIATHTRTLEVCAECIRCVWVVMWTCVWTCVTIRSVESVSVVVVRVMVIVVMCIIRSVLVIVVRVTVMITRVMLQW